MRRPVSGLEVATIQVHLAIVPAMAQIGTCFGNYLLPFFGARAVYFPGSDA